MFCLVRSTIHTTLPRAVQETSSASCLGVQGKVPGCDEQESVHGPRRRDWVRQNNTGKVQTMFMAVEHNGLRLRELICINTKAGGWGKGVGSKRI